MKITALVENQTQKGLRTVHGLALYIRSGERTILFDVGPDDTLFENAAALGLDLGAVDTVIISHGHRDHGGALEKFMAVNPRAKIYIQRSAFRRHYNRQRQPGKDEIGLDGTLMEREQIVLLDGDHGINEDMTLFVTPRLDRCYSAANDLLWSEEGKDDFRHEQNLILREGDKTALIMGCGHAGVVNILDRAEAWKPGLCVGGYHLHEPISDRAPSPVLLDEVAAEMGKRPIRYYTCHCTGQAAFDYLSARLEHMEYLFCGGEIEY